MLGWHWQIKIQATPLTRQVLQGTAGSPLPAFPFSYIKKSKGKEIMAVAVTSVREVGRENQAIMKKPAIELKVIGGQRPLFEVPAIKDEDRTFAIRFELTVDVLAPRAQIQRDLDTALRRFIPYRAIDPRIFRAVYLLQTGECRGPVEASRQVFGTDRHADKIRNRFNIMRGGR